MAKKDVPAIYRTKLSPEKLQEKLNRKAHRFVDKKKKAQKYACRK